MLQAIEWEAHLLNQMKKRTSSRRAKRQVPLLADLYGWSSARGLEGDFLDRASLEYPNWSGVVVTFIESLKANAASKREDDNARLIDELVRLDWRTQRLLRMIPDQELPPLLTLPVPNRIVRMFMLIRASQIASSALRQQVVLAFFHREDEDDTVRAYALEVLARGKWIETEKYAEIWWNSGDRIKKMVALKALEAARSPLFTSYHEAALRSDDSVLRAAAEAIQVIHDCE